MLAILLCALLFAAGHLVRDGLPATGSTHLARALGGALCGLGALAAYGGAWTAPALWAAVWAGLYLDSKHGEANEGAQPYALVSGLTSVIPAAAVLGAFGDYRAGALVIFVGCLKGPLWKLAYRFIPQPPAALFPPTRVAAMAFGFLFGLAAA